jgi:hypothetical protein
MKKLLFIPAAIVLMMSIMNNEKVCNVTELKEYQLTNRQLTILLDSMMNTFDYSCFDEVKLNRDSLLQVHYGFNCSNNLSDMAWRVSSHSRNGSEPTLWLEPVYTNKIHTSQIRSMVNSFAKVGNHRVIFDYNDIRIRAMFKIVEEPTEKFCVVDNNKDGMPGFPIDSHFVVAKMNGKFKVATSTKLDCIHREKLNARRL